MNLSKNEIIYYLKVTLNFYNHNYNIYIKYNLVYLNKDNIYNCIDKNRTLNRLCNAAQILELLKKNNYKNTCEYNSIDFGNKVIKKNDIYIYINNNKNTVTYHQDNAVIYNNSIYGYKYNLIYNFYILEEIQKYEILKFLYKKYNLNKDIVYLILEYSEENIYKIYNRIIKYFSKYDINLTLIS